jgi:hypothetical protein
MRYGAGADAEGPELVLVINAGFARRISPDIIGDAPADR